MSKSGKSKTVIQKEDAIGLRFSGNGSNDLRPLSESYNSTRPDSLFNGLKRPVAISMTTSAHSGGTKHEISQANTSPGIHNYPSEPQLDNREESDDVSDESLRTSHLMYNLLYEGTKSYLSICTMRILKEMTLIPIGI